MAAADSTSSVAQGAASGAWGCCKGAYRGVMCICGVFATQIKKMSVRTVTVLLRVFNLVNAFLLGLACYFAFQITNGSPTRFFLAVYIGVFAFLLFAFETRMRWTVDYIRRQCGFMFSYWGRAVFLIFLGAICFGMLDPSVENTNGYSACLGVGFATIANAWFNCFIICSHPGFQEANRAQKAPAGGDPSKLSDEQIRAYLEAHPELAAAAGASVKAEAVQPGATAEPEWARGRDKEPEPAKSTGGGFGAFGFGRKAAAKPDVEVGGYVPPPVSPGSAAASAPAIAVAPVDSGSNPFGGAAAAPATSPASAPVSTRAAAPTAAPPAHAPAPAPAPPRAPAPAPPVEDNPFANDNPFDTVL